MSSISAVLAGDAKKLTDTLQLTAAESRIEVQMLLQRVLQVNRAYLLAHPERTLGETEAADYQALFQRRLCGEPMAHILGEREFYGLNLRVTPDTLIPRPDTELLVELAVRNLAPPALIPADATAQAQLSVLDLGTGSGAIALAIAHECPHVKVTAVDASPEALAVARGNAERLGMRNIQLLPGSWFEPVKDEQYSLIVSNPPYIAESDPHLQCGDVRFEPVSALVAGADGLDDIRQIIRQAPAHLYPGGWLLLEHGYDQSERVRTLLQQAGFTMVFSGQDLAGIERVSGGRLPG